MKKDNLSTKHIFIFVDKEGETAYFYLRQPKNTSNVLFIFFFIVLIIL